MSFESPEPFKGPNGQEKMEKTESLKPRIVNIYKHMYKMPDMTQENMRQLKNPNRPLHEYGDMSPFFEELGKGGTEFIFYIWPFPGTENLDFADIQRKTGAFLIHIGHETPPGITRLETCDSIPPNLTDEEEKAFIRRQRILNPHLQLFMYNLSENDLIKATEKINKFLEGLVVEVPSIPSN